MDTYFCLSRGSLLLMRLARLVAGTEWTDELFLVEEWDECDRLVRDWPALWSNCIRQKMRSEGTSSNPYGGLVMTYLRGEVEEVRQRPAEHQRGLIGPMHSPLGALALRVEVRVSETVDAEAEHVVGLQGFAEEVAIATAILPETAREGGRASIGEKKIK